MRRSYAITNTAILWKVWFFGGEGVSAKKYWVVFRSHILENKGEGVKENFLGLSTWKIKYFCSFFLTLLTINISFLILSLQKQRMENVEEKEQDSVNLKLFTFLVLKNSKTFLKKQQLAKKATPNYSIWSLTSFSQKEFRYVLKKPSTLLFPPPWARTQEHSLLVSSLYPLLPPWTGTLGLPSTVSSTREPPVMHRVSKKTPRNSSSMS